MSVEPKKRGRKPKKKPYFGPEEEAAVKKYLELGTIIKDPNTQDGYRWTGTTHEDIQRNKIYLKVSLEGTNSILKQWSLETFMLIL
jgi:hypothetical protein